ncbi:Nucleotide-diphospho-sugar transferase family protein [Zostera marina]|uniref:Glycosyltransferase n=1 Tax=Zostera marina TaxID=29655 RepID=A0A0K9PG43_ZOSMR|nr:Nucleotide-diphospho-sugar transferase family protein [Zostera marina]
MQQTCENDGSETPNLCHCINSNHYNYLIAAVVLLLASVSIVLLISYDRNGGRFTSTASLLPDRHDIYFSESEHILLDGVLKKAAMDDDTVILTVLNAAWAKPGSVLDQFLESFRIGDRTLRLLDHLVIVSMDIQAYNRCKSVHSNCVPLSTPGVDFSGQSDFMTNGYLKMMWKRIDLLWIVLQKGYNFIFTDTDVMWFRDPLPMFYKDGDFQISCDYFRGNPLDIQNNLPNGGFNYVKSNRRTIEFYRFWYASRLKYPGRNDQEVLNFIKADPFINGIGLKIRFLDTAYFGGLCEKSEDFQKVCTMHANCCIGLSRKVLDLRTMLEDWKKFLSFAPNIRNLHSSFWSVPKNCSMQPII